MNVAPIAGLTLVPEDSPLLLRQPIPDYQGAPGDLREIARRMYACMVYPRNGIVGIGLAANQVGIAHRMFVMLATSRPAGFGAARACINPVIESQDGEHEVPLDRAQPPAATAVGPGSDVITPEFIQRIRALAEAGASGRAR